LGIFLLLLGSFGPEIKNSGDGGLLSLLSLSPLVRSLLGWLDARLAVQG
jgi:hypothetical protein